MNKRDETQEYEFNLKYYIDIFRKNKNIVFIVFLAAVAFSVILSFTIPESYEIITTIHLGSFDKMPLIKREEAKETILKQSSLLAVINELNLATDIENLKRNIQVDYIPDTHLINVKLRYYDVHYIFKINDALIKPLINEGKNIYNERIGIVNEQLKSIEEDVIYLEHNLNRIQEMLLASISSKNNNNQVLLKSIILENLLLSYKNNLNGLKNQRIDLKYLLVNSKAVEVFNEPVIPRKQVGPTKKKNIIKTAVFSLFFSVFLVLVIEALNKRKK